jgi:hypothetical protein
MRVAGVSRILEGLAARSGLVERRGGAVVVGLCEQEQQTQQC